MTDRAPLSGVSLLVQVDKSKFRPHLFEPVNGRSPVEPSTFLDMELARLRLRSRWEGSGGPRYTSEFHSGPADLPFQPPPKDWHHVEEWRREVAECSKREFEQGRADNDFNESWDTYNKKWIRMALKLGHDVNSSSCLVFGDVPWPVALLTSEPHHLSPKDIQAFLLDALQDRPPQNAVRLLKEEIDRWNLDILASEILPRVVEQDRELVEEAAAHVLSSLILMRQNLLRACQDRQGRHDVAECI